MSFRRSPGKISVVALVIFTASCDAGPATDGTGEAGQGGGGAGPQAASAEEPAEREPEEPSAARPVELAQPGPAAVVASSTRPRAAAAPRRAAT